MAELNDGVLQKFDEYTEQARRDWQIPGLAVALIKDDKVVFTKGYGLRDTNEATPVDEKTVFAIGSSTKAFAAAALAILVDEGKLKWDDPVAEYLPGFQIFDPYTSRQLSVRDLLTHRSGLARSDFLWYAQPFSRDEILKKVRSVEPNQPAVFVRLSATKT